MLKYRNPLFLRVGKQAYLLVKCCLSVGFTLFGWQYPYMDGERLTKMKNWKVPAIILVLVSFASYWVFRINGGMGTTLYIGPYAYTINAGLLDALWIGIGAIGIWLLLVIPWKRLKINLKLSKKLLIGIGSLVVISLIIWFGVSNASAKAKAAEQIHQQTIKSAADAELKAKQAEQAKKEAIAEAKATAEADLIAARKEDARIAKVKQDIAVQEAIANQKKTTSSNSTLTAPTLTTPALAAPIPVTSGVIESSIDGTFNGWTGDTIFKLQNGQIWQQSSYDYTYEYDYCPKVTIYKSGVGYKMKVDRVKGTISVTRIK